MRFRSDPARIRGSIAPLRHPLHQPAKSTTTGSAAGAVAALGGHTRHLPRRVDRRAGGADGAPSAPRPSGPSPPTVADRVPFLPGTGSAKLDETLELTAAAREAGADAVLVITPYYARPTQEALYHWYSTVAREFPDLPVVAYNVPSVPPWRSPRRPWRGCSATTTTSSG